MDVDQSNHITDQSAADDLHFGENIRDLPRTIWVNMSQQVVTHVMSIVVACHKPNINRSRYEANS